METRPRCKLYPEQRRGGTYKAGPAVPRRRLEHGGNAAPQIDGRLRQNPAYRPAHFDMRGTREMLVPLFSAILTKISMKNTIRRMDNEREY